MDWRNRLLVVLERIVATAQRAAMLLVLPLALLLFLQWPLRDILHLFSREANDFAQILFSLYVSVAIVAATRDESHLSVDTFAQHYSLASRARLRRVASLCILVPWSAFLLHAAWPLVMQSISQLEAFPDTYNPGYFIVKFAALLLAVMVLLQAIMDACRQMTRK